MITAVERLDGRIDEARRQHMRACQARDKAIKTLTRAQDKIVEATRALARLEKRRIAAKAEERKAAKRVSVKPGAVNLV